MNESTPIKCIRKGSMRIQLLEDISVDEIITALNEEGEILQNTRKRGVRRVGKWVIKASRFNRGTGIIKHTFRRNRYRTGWLASIALHKRGVPIPQPRVFIENGLFPIIFGNTLISDYLHNCDDVKTWAELHLTENEDEIPPFLKRLGNAIEEFHDANAYHQDLKTDNILTPDGKRFYFIDLDDVVLDKPYPDYIRLKNHVQLYYGLREIIPQEMLLDFVTTMKPDNISTNTWHQDVLRGYRNWVERKKRINAKR